MAAAAVMDAPPVTAVPEPEPSLATIAQVLADGACSAQCIVAYGRSCRPNPRRETAHTCDCPCGGVWHGRAARLELPGSEDYESPMPRLKRAPEEADPTLFDLSWEQAHGFPVGEDEASTA